MTLLVLYNNTYLFLFFRKEGGQQGHSTKNLIFPPENKVFCPPFEGGQAGTNGDKRLKLGNMDKINGYVYRNKLRLLCNKHKKYIVCTIGFIRSVLYRL
jgi:hypothetical protein